MSGIPHIVRLWFRVITSIVPIQAFAQGIVTFVAVKFHDADQTAIK